MSAFAEHAAAPAARVRSLAGRPWAVGAFLVGLTLFSAWFRTRAATAAFWMDEGLSVGIGSYPILDIPARLKVDGSPPLYYMALAAWMGWVGRTEAQTHLFSGLAATLTIPVGFLAGRTLFNTRTGVIAASLFGSSAFLTAYAQETRMYALLALLSLTTCSTFLLAFVAGRRRWLPVFSISLAAMLYTHGWGIFFGIACFATLLVLIARDPALRRRLATDGLIAFGLTGLLFAPWLPTLLYQSGHTGAPWAMSPDWGVPIQLAVLLGGQRIAFVLLIASALGFVRIATLGTAGSIEDRPPAGLGAVSTRRALFALLLIFALTVAIGWTVSQFNPAWTLRYLSAVLGPLLLAFAVAIARSGRLGIFGVVIVVFASFSPSINRDINLKSNVRNIATELGPKLDRGTLVIVGQPEQVPLAWYYLPSGMRYADPMGAVADPRMLDWVDVVDRIEAADPKRTWDRLAATVPPGGQVLLIRPLTVGIRNWSAPWTFQVRRRSAQWSELLRADRRFRREAVSPWFYIPAATVADSAVLYRRTPGR